MTRTSLTRRLLNQPGSRAATVASVAAGLLRTLDSLAAELMIRLLERRPSQD